MLYGDFITEAGAAGSLSFYKVNCHVQFLFFVCLYAIGDFGQLGLGESMTERKKPFPVAGLLSDVNIVQVECGGMHTVALSDQGEVSPNYLQIRLSTSY